MCDVGKEVEARHEAAYKLISNSKNVARFACRGASKEGSKQFSAPLADPYAVPNEKYVAGVVKGCLESAGFDAQVSAYDAPTADDGHYSVTRTNFLVKVDATVLEREQSF